MPFIDVARQRLQNERLVGAEWRTPEEAVAWMGAVQAQDYGGAKWGLGQRVRGSTDAAIDDAYQRGKILRTHVMRPTWHFVTPRDIRWLLELTADRVRAISAYYYRKAELDEATFRKSHRALEKVLRGGNHQTRAELAHVLAGAGITASKERLTLLMMRAELDAVICSGPRRGKQFTYALLDERAPPAPRRTRDEALAELTLRYFQSHGPATPQDFAWWSGLTVADAKAGLEMSKHGVVRDEVDGTVYWLVPSRTKAKMDATVVHLLPNYDELLIAYKDRGAAFDDAVRENFKRHPGTLDKHIVVVNGKVVGGWWRSLEKGAVRVEARLLRALDPDERRALQAAAERLGRFLGAPTRLLGKVLRSPPVPARARRGAEKPVPALRSPRTLGKA